MRMNLLRCSALGIALSLASITSTASAHEGCTKDADCAQGEVCFEEACSAPCKADADCPEEQTCAEATACVHGGDAHDEGCSAAVGSRPTDAIWGLAVVAAIGLVRVQRKRRTSNDRR
jgi:MYXO-CTERM domain-containing protein